MGAVSLEVGKQPGWPFRRCFSCPAAHGALLLGLIRRGAALSVLSAAARTVHTGVTGSWPQQPLQFFPPLLSPSV